MTKKVIRLNPLRRWSALLAGLVGIGFLIWFLGLMISPFPFEQNPMQSIMAFPVIMLLLLILLLIFVMWMIWSYSIEFSETGLRIGKYGNPIARRTNILYSDIKHIRRGTYRGWIEIVLLNGKSFILMTFVAGGSDGLIAELEKHVPSENFQPSLRKEMRRYSKSDLVRWGFPLFIWVILLLQFLPRMILPYVAWKTVSGEGFLPSGYINNYWISDNGTAWLSFMKSFDVPQLIRVDSSGSKSWTFDNREDVLYADAIIADNHGQPWLLHDDFYLHWNETSWQKIQSGGYSIRGTPPIVIENTFWTIVSREKKSAQHLLGVNLENGGETLFPIPDQLAEDGFYIQDISSAPNKAIFVLLVKKRHQEAFFYSFQDGQWNRLYSLDVEWYIPDPEDYSPDAYAYIQLHGFTVDDIGRTWVVSDNDDIPMIGRYDSLAANWEWSEIVPDCELCSSSYSEIVVDKLERVWLAGGYGRKNNAQDKYYMSQGWGVDVFIPNWDGFAQHLVRYTDKNSNYQVGIGATGIRLSQDGRIWVGRDRLVWIDSNNPDLPKPMPEWFAKVTNPGVILAIYIIGLALMAAFSFGKWIIKLFRNQNTSPPQKNS